MDENTITKEKVTPPYPKQDIPEAKKDQSTKEGKKWAKENIDYAIDIWQSNILSKSRRIKAGRDGYNGVVSDDSVRYLTHSVGSGDKEYRNIGNFVDYKLGRTKVDLLMGEWINTPLNARVEVINRDAKSKKLDSIKTLLGLQIAKEEVKKLREIVGVDVFSGIEPPEEKSQILSAKTMNEKLMQIAIDFQLKKNGLKAKLAKSWQDNILISEVFGYVCMDKDGVVDYEPIDIEDAIFLEIKNDPFLERSPFYGQRKQMFVHEIINRYGYLMDNDEINTVHKISGNPTEFLVDDAGRKYFSKKGSELLVDVFHIEWKSLEATHVKISPDKKNPDSEPYRKYLSHDFYEKNKKRIKKDVENGKYKIETVWKEVMWEGIRIGMDLYVGVRKVPYQIQTRKDGVKYRCMSGYTGLLFNTVNGTRVSFMELMINISHLYNVVLFQIHRELAKLKGKVLAYDEAFKPKGKTIKDILYNITNDGLYLYNSSQDGNRMRQNITVNGQIQEIDMGISQSFQQLANIKVQLEDTLDRLTGVSNNRQGMTQASSTVTNAISNINASRSITQNMFFMFGLYTEKVLTRIAEKTKLAWVYMNPDEGERVIGDDGVGFFKITKEFAFDDYTAFVGDGQKDRQLREKMELAATASLNAKELRMSDYGKFLASDTTGEAISILEDGWRIVKDIQQRTEQMRSESMLQNSQIQAEMMKENREDLQAHQKDMEILKASLKSQISTQEYKDKATLEMGNDQQENITI